MKTVIAAFMLLFNYLDTLPKLYAQICMSKFISFDIKIVLLIAHTG